MAILDNFEVIVLSTSPSNSSSNTTSDPIWSTVEEHEPPGSDNIKFSFDTCRKYIGVPPVRALNRCDRFSTEFAIDYKVKCGFTFPDQESTGVEYIVFQTSLDDEKIGSASVKRARWERSGTYRVRKQGKRLMLEDGQRWVRQRWTFDPGLHGSLKIEVWRERAEVPVVTDWGVIDLTCDNDPIVGQQELEAILHEKNVKRPRVKHLVKTDLLPIATFEFEYRSKDTLKLLGLSEEGESGMEMPQGQQEVKRLLSYQSDELLKTVTNTSASTGTSDSILDTLLDEIDQQTYGSDINQPGEMSIDPLTHLAEHTDAIGRSLLTGSKLSDIQLAHLSSKPTIQIPRGEDRFNFNLTSADTSWADLDITPIESKDLNRFGAVEHVDLTMLD